jgi:hypothetical protein
LLKRPPGAPKDEGEVPMSISSVSSTGSSTVNDAQLEKQIQQLQKEIVTEQNSKDDAKTKAQLVTDYQLEITVLQAEITAAQQQAQVKQIQQQASAGDDASSSGVEGARRKKSTDTSRYLDTSA